MAATRWRSDTPIYLQLRDRIAELILDSQLTDDDPLPSVREVAAEHQVNPLTVLKGYQLLVDEQIVESRRGRGMYVMAGAREQLLQLQRKQFIDEEWPLIRAKVDRLELKWDDLLAQVRATRKRK